MTGWEANCSVQWSLIKIVSNESQAECMELDVHAECNHLVSSIYTIERWDSSWLFKPSLLACLVGTQVRLPCCLLSTSLVSGVRKSSWYTLMRFRLINLKWRCSRLWHLHCLGACAPTNLSSKWNSYMASMCHFCRSSVACNHHRIALFGKNELARN